MRWFLWLLLVVALITGVLYGVGRFLLPNNLEVTRTASIERPRASVFAMINDLRIAKEWSPYYARDPDADYAFNGDPGEGQSMRWISNVREVGRGRMSIVSSSENEEVQSILEMGDRATLNSVIALRPGENATSVAWTVTADCAEGAVNVPCRYMNLIMRGAVGAELESGLTRLKTLTEQLPNVNFEGLSPQFDTIEPQNFVYSVVETSAVDLTEVNRAEAMGLEQVRRFMSEYQLTEAGPLVRVVTEYDQATNRMSFRVGYPFSGPTPLTVVGVQLGQTPSGEAMHVLVEGSRAQVRTAYAQMNAYMQAHRIAMRENGLPWEVVHNQGAVDGSTPTRLEIYMPLQ
ncbi:SRPBCC family protein [Terricaulis silvestris]|uniref:Polyketide cyclase / dehydrase and lipid transport n=1 Tax=Terricaulis silvestris TaxID=2686094 RepID=A0A6I6MV96_9CAUL|nr:SRPBCC family protein [Terricaulis silvestris]QGZ96374.1 Polyketide cyclase / dehydrase and lipid transport [Terricaulis silvestris]